MSSKRQIRCQNERVVSRLSSEGRNFCLRRTQLLVLAGSEARQQGRGGGRLLGRLDFQHFNWQLKQLDSLPQKFRMPHGKWPANLVQGGGGPSTDDRLRPDAG